MNTSPTLHYVYDPLCGWCYAAAPLIQAAQKIDGLNIEMHAGGLWVGDQVKTITPELRSYVLANDARIAHISGQVFGEDYQKGLLHTAGAVLNSEPPILAILTAQQLSSQGLDFLHAVQIAHFIDGREISRLDTLSDIAVTLGFERNAFEQAYEQTDVRAHLQHTRQLMNAWQIQGFPNFLLRQNDQWTRIPHSAFYGQPDAFIQHLSTLLNTK